jgi:hypothetical protein
VLEDIVTEIADMAGDRPTGALHDEPHRRETSRPTETSLRDADDRQHREATQGADLSGPAMDRVSLVPVAVSPHPPSGPAS